MENHLRKQIKKLLLEEDMKLYELAESLTEKTGRVYSATALSHRMGRGSITYQEMLVIAEILGYEIVFNKK